MKNFNFNFKNINNLYLSIALSFVCFIWCWYLYNNNVAPSYLYYIGGLTYSDGSYSFRQEIRDMAYGDDISFDEKDGSKYYEMKRAFDRLMRKKIPYVLVKPRKVTVKDQKKINDYVSIYGKNENGGICSIEFENQNVREAVLYRVGEYWITEIKDGVYHFNVRECSLVED